jgi:D-glycero-D-manno-heptose 1,7-bisphosphate phosphatase
MILAAARKYNIDLAASWMVGDAARDILAGKAAGCRTTFLPPDPGKTFPEAAGTVPDVQCSSLLEFVETHIP